MMVKFSIGVFRTQQPTIMEKTNQCIHLDHPLIELDDGTILTGKPVIFDGNFTMVSG